MSDVLSSPRIAPSAFDRIPDISRLPGDALLTDKQKALHSGFSIEAFKKWRREGRGPETVYIEGRPRSTVAAYRAWLASAQKVPA